MELSPTVVNHRGLPVPWTAVLLTPEGCFDPANISFITLRKLNPKGETRGSSGLLLVNSDESTVDPTGSCIPACVLWMDAELEMASFFFFCKGPWPPSALSSDSFLAPKHNACITKAFLKIRLSTDAVLLFTTHSAPKPLRQWKEEPSVPLSQETSASWLKVNHRDFGQILSSLENSLHMTHFRYPQILRREKTTHPQTHTLKTHQTW